jgi:prepilin-type N-terminal cleavage/methylation domain-containing protein
MDMTQNAPRRASGFTLVELSIVLVIFGLLIGGTLTFLSTQRDIVKLRETEKRLSEIRETLIGFAMVNGRLPCPAIQGERGVEKSLVSEAGDCERNYTGFVPGITLGVVPTNADGYAVDAWENPIRYAVTATEGKAFTKKGKLKEKWDTNAAALTIEINAPHVCTSSSQITGSVAGKDLSCGTGADLAPSVVAVLVSSGKNGGVGPISPDEKANSVAEEAGSGAGAFVFHTPTAADSEQGEFDDIVVWISPNIFYSRMIAAGRLP